MDNKFQNKGYSPIYYTKTHKLKKVMSLCASFTAAAVCFMPWNVSKCTSAFGGQALPRNLGKLTLTVLPRSTSWIKERARRQGRGEQGSERKGRERGGQKEGKGERWWKFERPLRTAAYINAPRSVQSSSDQKTFNNYTCLKFCSLADFTLFV